MRLAAGEAEAVVCLLKQAELERFAESAALPEVEETTLSTNLSRHFYRPLPQMTDYEGLLINRVVATNQAEATR